jgi:hypothetical protein
LIGLYAQPMVKNTRSGEVVIVSVSADAHPCSKGEGWPSAQKKTYKICTFGSEPMSADAHPRSKGEGRPSAQKKT